MIEEERAVQAEKNVPMATRTVACLSQSYMPGKPTSSIKRSFQVQNREDIYGPCPLQYAAATSPLHWQSPKVPLALSWKATGNWNPSFWKVEGSYFQLPCAWFPCNIPFPLWKQETYARIKARRFSGLVGRSIATVQSS